MILLTLSLFVSQDLLERARNGPGDLSKIQTSPGRLDMRIGPALERRGAIDPGHVDFNLDFVPDLACGRFDLAASFKSIFSKNLKDQLVGALIDHARSELAGSAMILACQMSPTVCDAMKHYRVTAQDFLGLQLKQCQSIEELSGGADGRWKAAAIKECLERRQAEGVPLDEAMRECRSATEIRGIGGRQTREIDLSREVALALGLNGDSKVLLDEYLSGMTYSTSHLKGRVKVRSSDLRYQRKREDRSRKLRDAVQESATGIVPPKTLSGLTPPGTAPMTNLEVQRLAAMTDVDRSIVIDMLASAMSLAETVGEGGEVLGALAAARGMTTATATQQAIDQEMRRLEIELQRLKEGYEMASLVQQARLRADSATRDAASERSYRATAAWRDRDRRAADSAAAREWNASCPTR